MLRGAAIAGQGISEPSSPQNSFDLMSRLINDVPLKAGGLKQTYLSGIKCFYY